MNIDFVNLTTENFENEYLFCIIRSKKPHQGIEAKRQWLSDRLKEGHEMQGLRFLLNMVHLKQRGFL